jgi:hypothetical protein
VQRMRPPPRPPPSEKGSHPQTPPPFGRSDTDRAIRTAALVRPLARSEPSVKTSWAARFRCMTSSPASALRSAELRGPVAVAFTTANAVRRIIGDSVFAVATSSAPGPAFRDPDRASCQGASRAGSADSRLHCNVVLVDGRQGSEGKVGPYRDESLTLGLAAMRSDSNGESGTRLSIASRSKLTLALLSVAVSVLGLPTGANATFAFNTDRYDPRVWVSGNDDGTEATYVGRGLVAQVSPDGELLAYEHGSAFIDGWGLMIYDVASGKRSVRLMRMHTIGENKVGERTAFAWSPDSTMVAALQNERRNGRQTLYVIHVRGGGKRRIATGHFRGVSFSPDSKEVVFGLARSGGHLPGIDIARPR